jgi:hypothetical protein
MSITYDGNFDNPTAVGTPIISYPISNYQSLFFVEQEFVQTQASYFKPTFGFNHHLYTGATFSEQTGIGGIGGGLLRFTWRFCHIPTHPLEETIYESVNFIGMRTDEYRYTEYVDYNWYEREQGSVVQKTRSAVPINRKAYNVVIREPFSRLVRCKKVTEFENIAVGASPAPAPIQPDWNGKEVTYMGAKYPATIRNGTLYIITPNGEVVITAKDGQYHLPRPKPNVRPEYKDNFFEIQNPLLVYKQNANLVHNQIKAQADASPTNRNNMHTRRSRLGFRPVQVVRNASNPFDFKDENTTSKSVVQYVDNKTEPSLAEYEAYIGKADMLVAPTVVEQYSGTIYTKQTITTTWL